MLYILVALAATGALPFKELEGSEAPLADVLDKGAGFPWGATVISIGALIAITSVVLTVLYGQTRIMFAMSPRRARAARLASVQPSARRRSTRRSSSRVLIASSPRSCRSRTIAELVNIGTLFAFLLVNIGVMILRRTRAGPGARLPRPARCGSCAPIGASLCIYLMVDLPADDVAAVRRLARARAR